MDEHEIDAFRAANLRAAVQQKYEAVARDRQGHFPYPVGQESLVRLGYAAEWIGSDPCPHVPWRTLLGRTDRATITNLGRPAGARVGLQSAVDPSVPAYRAVPQTITRQTREARR